MGAVTGSMPMTRCLTLQPVGEGGPLVCLPGAGGRAHYFDRLVGHLGDERPVYGLQSYGLEPDGISREMRAYAARCIHVLQVQRQKQGPYRLLGHSVGGVVAFEMANQLVEMGEEVAFLGILDTVAPVETPRNRYAAWTRGDWQRHIATRMEKHYGVTLELGFEGVADEDEWLGLRMQAAGLLPRGSTPVTFSRFVDVYSANVTAVATYPGRKYGGKLTLFRALEEDAALQVVGGDTEDERYGWGRLAAEVEVVRVGGTHITMMAEPFVAGLGELLRERLRA